MHCFEKLQIEKCTHTQNDFETNTIHLPVCKLYQVCVVALF